MIIFLLPLSLPAQEKESPCLKDMDKERNDLK